MRWQLLFLGLILIVTNISLAQESYSVIRLKNGVKIKGNIIEFVNDDYIMIEVMEGQGMRIPFDNIRMYKMKNGKLREFNLPGKGFFNYTNTGLLFTKSSEWDPVEANFTVHTINGYRYDEKFYGGLGVGLDRYGSASALPVYLSLRADLIPAKVSPVINGNVGYGWMWENENFNEWDDFDEVQGGLYWEIGAGLRINYKKTALVFNYAYKRQNSELTYTNFDWWRAETTLVENHKFRNMVLTVGMEF